ncbi:MAG: hypothetical protein GX265_00090 [Mollicutes bacterium]|jgi:hypothetical protein|nr:hypothetical protein [Mollicutes bacterium]
MEQEILDLKLELELLQKKDYEDALNHGIDNKKDWYEYIIKQDKDEIAEAVINVAKRYNVLAENVANIFDSTMVMRITKVMQSKKGLKK